MRFPKSEAEATYTFTIKKPSGQKFKEMVLMEKEVIHMKISERDAGFPATRKFWESRRVMLVTLKVSPDERMETWAYQSWQVIHERGLKQPWKLRDKRFWSLPNKYKMLKSIDSLRSKKNKIAKTMKTQSMLQSLMSQLMGINHRANLTSRSMYMLSLGYKQTWNLEETEWKRNHSCKTKPSQLLNSPKNSFRASMARVKCLIKKIKTIVEALQKQVSSRVKKLQFSSQSVSNRSSEIAIVWAKHLILAALDFLNKTPHWLTKWETTGLLSTLLWIGGWNNLLVNKLCFWAYRQLALHLHLANNEEIGLLTFPPLWWATSRD